mmetsp:Transcript_49795/g.98820  ORF Transcript_49795/g.98820 Transcript_49795/m.98820 type:complete len:230 (-) Transcript_49795:592-1281(-)
MVNSADAKSLEMRSSSTLHRSSSARRSLRNVGSPSMSMASRLQDTCSTVSAKPLSCFAFNAAAPCTEVKSASTSDRIFRALPSDSTHASPTSCVACSTARSKLLPQVSSALRARCSGTPMSRSMASLSGSAPVSAATAAFVRAAGAAAAPPPSRCSTAASTRFRQEIAAARLSSAPKPMDTKCSTTAGSGDMGVGGDVGSEANRVWLLLEAAAAEASSAPDLSKASHLR